VKCHKARRLFNQQLLTAVCGFSDNSWFSLIPISKIDSLRDVLEENNESLCHSSLLSDWIPTLLVKEKTALLEKLELKRFLAFLMEVREKNCLQDYVEMASIGCYNDHFHNSSYH
jgi:flagellar biosynthesis/type III secretory pathway chaperone